MQADNETRETRKRHLLGIEIFSLDGDDNVINSVNFAFKNDLFVGELCFEVV